MKANSGCNLYSYNQITDVPAEAGLYAWYVRMQIGKANIRSAENTVKALCRLAESIRYPDLGMHLQGHLNLQLKGNLSHLWYGHDENKHDSVPLTNIINDADGRIILNEIFDLAVPLLCSPLYIGVSKNLKARLQNHTRFIEMYRKDITQQKAVIANIVDVDDLSATESDKSFAMRVVERGIDPNMLLVGVMHISQKKHSLEVVRKTVEAAETLLNRMFYPILGRR